MFAQGLDEQLFVQLERTARLTDYSAVQTRRVLSVGAHGVTEWVGATETVMHRGEVSATAPERFAIELRGFEGISMDPAELARRQMLHQTQAAYLFRYQSFRVLDPRLASQNYVVQPIVQGCNRANRRCNRVAIIALAHDRPSWLLDIDAATAFPLYCGEFTSEGRLVSELEVSHISFGSAAMIPSGDSWAWRPNKDIADFVTALEASRNIRSVTTLPLTATDIGVGYLFDRAQVITDPLTADQALVLVFHDGLDALFVHQRSRPPLQQDGNVARFYSEFGVHQCMFQHRQTEFLVVGRNANLRRISSQIHRLAVTTW